MADQAEETKDGVIVFLKKIITYDKLFGSATLVTIVGIIWWAAVTHTKVEGNTTDILEIKKIQNEDRAKVDAVTITPIVNTEQIKQLQKDVSATNANVALIFNKLEKKDSSQIKMLDMLTYLYNKNKK